MALLFFACGLPFGLLTETLPLLLRSLDLSALAIGRASALQLAWAVRLAWAPAIDRTRSLSGWLRRGAWSLALGLVALAFALERASIPALFVALAATSLASATLESCADATLVRLRAQGRLSEDTAGGLRTACFKAGLTLGAGGSIAMAGARGWVWPLCAMAGVVLCASFFFVALAAELPPVPRLPGAQFRAGMWRWLSQPMTWWVLLYAITYKLALHCVGPMAKLMWLEREVPIRNLGATFATVGLVGAISGAGCTTLLCARFSLGTALGVGTMLEFVACVANAAAMRVAPLGAAAWPFVASCSLLEALAQGLTTSALTLLMLRHVEHKFGATQYSLLGTSFALTRALGGFVGTGLLANYGAERGFLLAATLALVCLAPMRKVRTLLGADAVT